MRGACTFAVNVNQATPDFRACVDARAVLYRSWGGFECLDRAEEEVGGCAAQRIFAVIVSATCMLLALSATTSTTWQSALRSSAEASAIAAEMLSAVNLPSSKAESQKALKTTAAFGCAATNTKYR